MRKRTMLITVILIAAALFTLAACDGSLVAVDQKVNPDECEHAFGEWTEVRKPTCVDEGLNKRVCQRCETEETESVPVIEHSYTRREPDKIYRVKPATCSTQAVYKMSCAVCGKEGEETFEFGKTDGKHDFSNEVADKKYLLYNATCTSKAVYKKSCSLCGESGEDTFESGNALGHDFTAKNTDKKHLLSEADCQNKAVYKYSCSRCGLNGTDTFIDEESVGDHKYKDGACLLCGTIEPAEVGLTYRLDGDGYIVTGYNGTDSAIEIPDTYKNKAVTGIDADAFAACEELMDLAVPASVVQIASGAFANCDNLTTLTVASGNSKYYASGNCIIETATKTLVAGCNLSAIPNDVTAIGERAFEGCKGIIEIKPYTVATSYSDIAKYADTGAQSTVLQIPNGVLHIGDHAFKDCTGITKAELCDSVVTIGNGAFAGCNALTEIVLGDQITDIGDNAFDGCSLLSKITFNGTVDKWNGINKGTGWNLSASDYTVSCVDGTVKKDGTVQKTTAGLNFRLNADGDSYAVAGVGTATDTEIVIPSSYQGKPVTNILRSAFTHNEKIIGVIMPDSVTTVEKQAFQDCKALKNVTLSNNLALIDSDTFDDCESLESIFIPDGVTVIGERAFFECDKLSSVRLSQNLTEIKGHIFTNSSITEINLPASVVTIGDGAFARCAKLERITVDSGNTVFKSEANCLINIADKTLVAGCKTSVIPTDGSVTKIGNCAFYGSNDLTELVIPNGIESIGYEAFRRSGLTSVSLPTSVLSLGGWSFGDCKELLNVDLSDGLQSIDVLAFANCVKLGSVEIPESVTNMEHSNFSGCSELTDVKLPTGLTVLGAGTFRDCVSLASIDLPSGLRTIKEYTFINCSSLGAVTLPKGIDGIGYDAFNGCEKLTLNGGIPSSVTSMGERVFKNCKKLTSMRIPDGVKYLNSGFFEGCDNLSSVTLGEGLTYIGSGVFKNCGKLTSVTLPDNVERIMEEAFVGCVSLTTLKIGSGLVYMTAEAFSDSPLRTITVASDNTVFSGSGNCIVKRDTKTLILGCNNSVIPNDGTVSAIGEYAFYNCNKITNVVIPDGVSEIGAYAFWGCAELERLRLPAISQSFIIGAHAFSGCTSLMRIDFGGSEDEWAFVIEKGVGWDEGTPDYLVYCGEIIMQKGDEVHTYGLEYTLNSDHNSYSVSYGRAVDTDVIIPAFYYGKRVTAIAENGFAGIGITSVRIPNGVETIGASAFISCSSLIKATMPNTLKSIGNQAFFGCESLQNIEIPVGVTEIGGEAFCKCNGLTEIEIPEGVVTIGTGAFEACDNLTTVSIPKSVTKIEYGAFMRCSEITTFIYGGTDSQWAAIRKEDYWDAKILNYTVRCTNKDIVVSAE